MKIPTKCPKCQSKILNAGNHFQCSNIREHLWCFGNQQGILQGAAVQIYPTIFVFWLFIFMECKIYDGPWGNNDNKNIKIPYFEPDFSNYNALIEKIKVILNFY
jgi:hypothetical protein